ncbi:hypothetical protein BCR44DRAFT_1414746 [Catenaria anguillulae PL171]|uniref:Uncharacterized protein n=1 Tax=Catenaria anguillulae PL171 TaxID=765915 RepID=A0A1Y2HMW1_9FUNG|nr:hypothetical protein BCR44DRAFT_1414746 [Catenaria anguillulae PL171]
MDAIAVTVASSPLGDVVPSQAFIQIVGLPSGSDPTNIDTVVVHSANITSPKPSVPQLSPGSAQKYLVDVIDAENEDPFTLESFESLLEIAAEAGKDFILARVVTVDPHDDSKFYHRHVTLTSFFYYAAHHINKVLFRTQPEEGLLHRMKAKNPLNNMTIVGDVHYYVISPEAYRSARAAAGSPVQSSPSSAGSNRSARRAENLFGKRKKKKTVAEMIRDSLFSDKSKDSVPLQNQTTDYGNKRKLRLVLTEPDKLLEKDGNAATALIHSDSHHVSSNATNIPKLAVDTQAAASTGNGGRRPSADDIFAFVSKSSPVEEKGSGLIELDLGRLAPPQHLHGPGGKRSPDAVDRRGRSMERTGSDRQPRSKSTTAAHASKPDEKNDWLDRFYSKSHAGPRPGDKVKVRSTSYRNERLQAGGDDPHMLTVEEWISVHCGESVTKLLTTKPGMGNSATSTSVASSPVSAESGESSAMTRRLAANPPTSKRPEPAKQRPAKPPIKYEARFFATDDDFLMKSSVRSFFKQHAVEADDAVLFSIPSHTTVVLPQHDEHGNLLEPHPALNGFSYSIEGADDEALLGNGIGARLRRFARGHHVLKIALVLYIVTGGLLVKFLVPESMTYLVTFLLVFVLCFFLVFFVECDV